MLGNMETDSLISETDPPSSWIAWAQLVRLPNVFTVLADVSAAFLLVAHGPQPHWRLICVVLAGAALYWAGMVLNDVFDVDRDRQERPTRPLAAGQISLPQAKAAGWGLLVLGVVLAAASGYLPSETLTGSWVPAAVGIALASMIVAYDGPLKNTILAPVAMGSCRVLSFLLGAAPCMSGVLDEGPLFPRYVVAIALGFGMYVMGITTMARDEATGGPSANLPRGLLVTMIGAAMLAFAPQTASPQIAQGNIAWHMSTGGPFPMMIALIALPVILRGLRVISDPTPAKIQTTIKVGVLTIIPLAAAFAFLGAGPVWGLAVFSLAVPSIVLGSRLRVT